MELIKIEKSKGGKDVVDARHLHQALGIETQFSKWIQRMFEYGFKENFDYAIVKNVYQENQHVSVPEKIDYVLTIDCCKHIAMIQRTPQGMTVRQYFIDYEKQSYLPVQIAPKTRLELAKENLALIEEIEAKDALLLEQAPKVEFFDQVSQSKSEISIGEASKVLCLQYGSITLFKKLRKAGVLMHDNIPYQTFIDRGWFRVVERKYLKKDNTWGIGLKTVVYQKGLDGIRKLLSN